jgi:hypothetical protein
MAHNPERNIRPFEVESMFIKLCLGLFSIFPELYPVVKVVRVTFMNVVVAKAITMMGVASSGSC